MSLTVRRRSFFNKENDVSDSAEVLTIQKNKKWVKADRQKVEKKEGVVVNVEASDKREGFPKKR
jgi:hypothetical protein